MKNEMKLTVTISTIVQIKVHINSDGILLRGFQLTSVKEKNVNQCIALILCNKVF